MRVRMRVTISGTRNGKPWPPRGKSVDLPDSEAEQMVAGGLAERCDGDLPEQPREETATRPAQPEKATARRRSAK